MRMSEFVDEWYVLRTTQNGEFVGDARPAHFVCSSSRCLRSLRSGSAVSCCCLFQLVVSSISCETCCVTHIAHSAMAQGSRLKETASMRSHHNSHRTASPQSTSLHMVAELMF